MPSPISIRMISPPTSPPLRAGERIRLLHERLGDHLVATTSFGMQAAVMLHLIHEHAPKIPVVFIDTGFLFPETYRYIGADSPA
jgi:phosphoadenosine phosphosulfate reductase